MAAPTPAPAAGSSRRLRDSNPSDAVVGQFKIQMEIGKGSFATVYRAIHMVRRPSSSVLVRSRDADPLWSCARKPVRWWPSSPSSCRS